MREGNTVIQKMLVRAAIAFGALLLLGQQGASADEIVNVTVNTSGLGAGNSEVFFILTGIGGNTATLGGILLGGGAAGAVDTANVFGSGGNANNDLSSSISLTDNSDFLNVFPQSFVAGTELSFHMDLTTNVVSPNPDQFSFAILDPSGNPIPTSDPTGFDNLLTINLDSTNPRPNIYSNLVTVTAPTPVPEPSALLLIGTGLLALAAACKYLVRGA
jgi:hypothetical protein